MKKRAWLNPTASDDTGAIALNIEKSTTGNMQYVNLTIRDCSRQITLDFDYAVTNKKALQQRLDKCNIITKYVEYISKDIEKHLAKL